MPSAVLLLTRTSEDPWWLRPRAVGKLAYSLFRTVDPALSESLHTEASPKPFSISAIRDDDAVVVRLTALNGATECVLPSLLDFAGTDRSVDLGDTQIVFTDARVDPTLHSAAYAHLARARFRTHNVFRFVSPTTFKQGIAMTPLPVPSLLLGSWARRWNAFCAEQLRISDETLADISSRVGIAALDIATETCNLRPGAVVGFTGRVCLETLKAPTWNAHDKAIFSALAAFAPYCGTGWKTTEGFGLTVRERAAGAG